MDWEKIKFRRKRKMEVKVTKEGNVSKIQIVCERESEVRFLLYHLEGEGYKRMETTIYKEYEGSEQVNEEEEVKKVNVLISKCIKYLRGTEITIGDVIIKVIKEFKYDTKYYIQIKYLIKVESISELIYMERRLKEYQSIYNLGGNNEIYANENEEGWDFVKKKIIKYEKGVINIEEEIDNEVIRIERIMNDYKDEIGNKTIRIRINKRPIAIRIQKRIFRDWGTSDIDKLKISFRVEIPTSRFEKIKEKNIERILEGLGYNVDISRKELIKVITISLIKGTIRKEMMKQMKIEIGMIKKFLEFVIGR